MQTPMHSPPPTPLVPLKARHLLTCPVREGAGGFSGVSRLLGMSDWYEIGGGPGLNSFIVGVLGFTVGKESGKLAGPEKLEPAKQTNRKTRSVWETNWINMLTNTCGCDSERGMILLVLCKGR